MRHLLLLLILIPTSAWAEALPPQTPVQTTAPHAKGPRHVCVDYLNAAIATGREGKTGLAFQISAIGKVEALIVASSSGTIVLDLLSTKCASSWLYEPALQDSVPVTSPWTTQIGWTLGYPRKFSSPEPVLPFSSCVKSYPDVAERTASGPKRISLVRYDISDGAVTGAALSESSGDPVLDGYALSCVKTWQFKPFYENGKPATGNHLAIIDWSQKTLP